MRIGGLSFTRRAALLTGLGAMATPALAPALAQTARPTRIIVPFPPGGSNDVLARGLAERLQALLGHPFAVDNRPGAGGTIGAALAASAAPDGQTLMFTSSSLATASAAQPVPFDPLLAFQPVAKVAEAPMVVVAAPGFPVTGVAELVRHAKAEPGRVLFGTGGQGDATHFAAALLTAAAGIEVEYVPYAGMAAAQTDLMASRVNAIVTTRASMGGALAAGSLKLLAYTSAARMEEAPEVPTVREAGIDYEFTVWWGLLAPRGLPMPMAETVNEAIGRILQDPAYLRLLRNAGSSAAPAPVAAFTETVQGDMRRFRQAAIRMGLRAG